MVKREIYIEIDIDKDDEPGSHGPADATLSVFEDGELKDKWTPAQLVSTARMLAGFALQLLDKSLESLVEVEKHIDKDGNIHVVKQPEK
ncbi:MAG: hypothetical protein IK114_14190 [Fibrobacter sp.]|nr:hypothetical protein [Fibrobacter sp.]